MLISELEIELKELREKYGDLPVYCNHDSDELYACRYLYPGLEEFIWISHSPELKNKRSNYEAIK